MEPSDWIAVGALCISALALFTSVLVSVAGFWFNYKTNQDNIRARRAEIAMENSIEAFREVIEKLHILAKAVGDKDKAEVNSVADDCLETFIRYRLYFPQSLGGDLVKIVGQLARLPGSGDEETVGKQFDNVFTEVRGLIDRMQRYIGLDVEKPPNPNP